MTTPKYTIEDKLLCAMRELAIRRAVYPKRVLQKKMSQHDADYELGVMQDIVNDYLLLKETT